MLNSVEYLNYNKLVAKKLIDFDSIFTFPTLEVKIIIHESTSSFGWRTKNDMKQIEILKKVISPQMEHPDFSGDTKTPSYTKRVFKQYP